MASQRIIVSKIGGQAGHVAWTMLKEWAEARQSSDSAEWCSTQWPRAVRDSVDNFIDRLRENSEGPPIIYYAEWVDFWSMGDVLSVGVDSASMQCRPLRVMGERYEVDAYQSLSAEMLRSMRPVLRDSFDETRWFRTRLIEAAHAWSGVVENGLVVVARRVFDGLFEDHEIAASLSHVPNWLVES